jgi:hypothetical protein
LLSSWNELTLSIFHFFQKRKIYKNLNGNIPIKQKPYRIAEWWETKHYVGHVGFSSHFWKRKWTDDHHFIQISTRISILKAFHVLSEFSPENESVFLCLMQWFIQLSTSVFNFSFVLKFGHTWQYFRSKLEWTIFRWQKEVVNNFNSTSSCL